MGGARRTGATTAVLGALIALGLIAAVVFALGGPRALSGEAGRESETPREERSGGVAATVSLAEPHGAREEVAGGAVAPESGRTSGEVARVTLRVRVVALETQAPLGGVRVGVLGAGVVASDVESTRGTLTLAPRTGAEGEVEFAFEPPAGKTLRLAATGASDALGGTSLVLAPFTAGERRELVLALPTEPDLPFHGRVLDDASGAPIAGASLATLAGTREPVPAGASAADGHFALRLCSWRHELLVVSAAGYAPLQVPVTRGHDSPGLGREVRLARHASLTVRLTEGAGVPVSGALVVLRAEQDQVLLEGGSTFFRRRGDEQVSATSDETGACRFEALVPDVALRVDVQRGGGAPWVDLPPITLRAGETRALEWHLDASARLTGLVVDPFGAPVPNEELWLQRATADGPTFFEVGLARGGRSAKSDAAGRFEFAEVPAGAWWLGPAARRRPSDAPDLAGLAPFAERIELAHDVDAHEVRVVVHRGLFVRGRVLAADESGAADTYVFGSLAPSAGLTLTAETGEDGLFVLGPLVPGRYSLVAQRSGEGESAPVEVEAGGDVLLRLARGGVLRGAVLADDSGLGVSAWVRAARGTPGFWCQVNTMEDGSFALDGLTAGTYDVCARAGGGLVGSLRVTVLAGEESVVTLRLARGATLRLRLPSGADGRSCRVLRDGLELEVVELQPGQPVEVVVPAGTITVTGDQENSVACELVLEAGEFREFELGAAAR